MRRHGSTQVALAVAGLLAGAMVVAGPVPAAGAQASIEVSSVSELMGGQDVSIVVSGLTPGVLAGWCQGIAIPSGTTPSTSYCGSGTTTSSDADDAGQLAGTVHLQRFLYIPAEARWVDCTDPAETCTIGAAEASDIPGTGAAVDLSFGPVPAPPSTRGTVDVERDGTTAEVTGAGFRPGAVIDVHQCVTGADHPSGCGLAKVVTSADGSGAFDVVIGVDPSVTPPGGDLVTCGDGVPFPCTIIAAEAVDFPGTFASAPLPPPAPAVPKIVPGYADVVEGPPGGTAHLELPVTLSTVTSLPVSVLWRTVAVPGWPGDQAEPGADYQAASGTLEFPPGEVASSITVDVMGDALAEPDEYLVVQFGAPTNAGMGGVWGLGFGEILDDDPVPVATPGVGLVAEGDEGTVVLQVPVSLSNPSSDTITMPWTTRETVGWLDGQADPGVDYTPTSGIATFPPGATTAYVDIPVIGDTLAEVDEYILVLFGHPTNGVLGGWGVGFGSITDDD